MEARSMPVREVFFNGGDVHYFLPRFQRAYSWNEKNWQPFLDDVLNLQRIKDEQLDHFMGSIVVIEEGMRDATMPVFTLVDGQQRLLTISILLRVLFELSDDNRLHRQIYKYMVNEDREGDIRYKLFPTQNYGDRSAWENLVNCGGYVDAESRSRIDEAYTFFKTEMSRAFEQESVVPESVYNAVISKLQIVFVNLKREERPHQIFESLNARGEDLTQPDLVRNYLAMRLPQTRQNDAFEKHWVRIEEKLDERRDKEQSNFLRHYLARRSRRVVELEEIYSEFRERMESILRESDLDAFYEELTRLHSHARFYDRLLRPRSEPNEEIRKRLVQLNTLRRTVMYPFLLSLCDAYESKSLAHKTFL